MPEALLKVVDLQAWYGESHILHGVGFEIGVAFQLFDIPLLLTYSLSFAAVVLIIETLLVQPFETRVSRWRLRAT